MSDARRELSKAKKLAIHKIKSHLQAISLTCDLLLAVERDREKTKDEMLKHLEAVLNTNEHEQGRVEEIRVRNEARAFVERYKKELADEKDAAQA